MTPLSSVKVEHSQDLLQHINSQDPHIQFTVEPTLQGSLPFLDTLVTIQPDNTLSTFSIQKTHTHRPIPPLGDSNHHITAKQSVYNTLAHRAKTVFSTQQSMDKELSHIKTALHHCQFPSWALNQWGTQVQPTPTTIKAFQQQQQPCQQKQLQNHHSSTLHQ